MIQIYLKETIIACILSFICSVVPAYITAKNNLKEKPSDLLLPKPPAKGSKILLERIKFIWNKMNFTHRVTARNIFRYKKRMLMTIFGVAGASALIFTGFSVQQLISTINDKQFKDIIKYDIIKDSKDNDIEAKISGICEMYAGHFMFMSKTAYEKIYNTEYKTNAYMLTLKDNSTENTENVSAKFMELSSVMGVVQNTTLYNQINTIFDPSLWIGAYIIPFIVVNIVTFALKFYINKKLINVDMIEALKSVD